MKDESEEDMCNYMNFKASYIGIISLLDTYSQNGKIDLQGVMTTRKMHKIIEDEIYNKLDEYCNN